MALEGKRINELTEVSKVDTSSKVAVDTGGEEALSITLKNLIDSSGVSSVDVATTEKAGIVKPDGTTISVSSDGTISSTVSGFSFEGTKAEFDAAVAAGTITDDSVSLITDDVSGDTVATKADLAVALNERADKQLSNTNLLTNCILSAPNGVMQVSSTDPYTLVVNKGLKVALANGYNADGTPKSEIVTLENDVSVTLTPGDANFLVNLILVRGDAGGFIVIVPAITDFQVVSSLPSSTPTRYTVFFNVTENKLYEYYNGSGGLNIYNKFVMLGSAQLTNGQFAQVFPHKPIQLSLEGLGDYVVEFQVNSDGSWYRKYKSGWLEQGGGFASNDDTNTVVTLLKPYANTTYSIMVGMMIGISGNANYWVFSVTNKTTSTVTIHNATNGAGNICQWEAKGMGAN